MKKIMTYLFITVSLAVFMVVPVLAADSNGNEFVNMDQYANYVFSDDNSSVTVDLKYPSEWNKTYLYLGPEWAQLLGIYTGNSFTDDWTIDQISMRMLPLGGNMGVGDGAGFQVKNAHIIDLEYLPTDTNFSYQFSVTIESTEIDIGDTFYEMFFYVDGNGQVIKKTSYSYTAQVYREDGAIRFVWSRTYPNKGYMPEGAVGIIPMFIVKNVPVDDYSVTVALDSFTMEYSMGALEYQSKQNEKLQSTLNSIQDSMNELVDGEPDPVAPSGSDVVGDLNSAEDELKDMTQGGLDEAIGLLQNTLYVLQTNATAFFAVIALFRPFSQIPLFAGLLTISLSVSVCAIILAITHDIGKASKANKSKSGHNGKKGG